MGLVHDNTKKAAQSSSSAPVIWRALIAAARQLTGVDHPLSRVKPQHGGTQTGRFTHAQTHRPSTRPKGPQKEVCLIPQPETGTARARPWPQVTHIHHGAARTSSPSPALATVPARNCPALSATRGAKAPAQLHTRARAPLQPQTRRAAGAPKSRSERASPRENTHSLRAGLVAPTAHAPQLQPPHAAAAA